MFVARLGLEQLLGSCPLSHHAWWSWAESLEASWGRASLLGLGPAAPRSCPLSLTAGVGLDQQASQWSVTLCLTEQGAGAKGDFPPHLYPKLNSICSNACYNFKECLSCLSSAKHSQIMAEGQKKGILFHAKINSTVQQFLVGHLRNIHL